MGNAEYMGESSAPRRPTHDTNTSRREVKITYTRQQHVIKAKHIQIHDEVYQIDCIYFDASCCSYGFNSFCKVHCICRTWVVDSSDPLSFHSRPLSGCPKKQPKPCCR